MKVKLPPKIEIVIGDRPTVIHTGEYPATLNVQLGGKLGIAASLVSDEIQIKSAIISIP